MARKRDELAAAKAKKQKTILIIGGVLLLAVAAIQVPKLMKKDAPPVAASATTTEAPVETGSSAGVVTGETPAGAPVAVAQTKTGAVVAGVALPRATVVSVAPSQLASFTLFEVKDPFVQQATEPGAAGAATDPFFSDTGGDTSTPPADAGTGGTSDSQPAPPPPPVIYATINLNGKPQQTQVKGKFPAADPLFVLRSLTKKNAKIGVAGGSFDDGQAVTLAYGKKLTLVNTATGVRYELKLVYTGATPEVIQGFTTKPAQPTTTAAAAGALTTAAAAK